MSRKRSGTKSKRYTFTQRGSAIIMALVTMMLLLMLGLAVATVSMGTLNNNVADASNSDAYYAAQSATDAAIEQLKHEVSAYYEAMLTTNSTDYPALYANFFSGINNNAKNHFLRPEFGDGITTSTTFTTGTYDSANSICPFLISSTATTADGSKYKFTGTLNVKKVDVRKGPGVWLTIDDVALKVGGTLNNTNGFSVQGGNIVTSVFNNPRKTQWYLGYEISSGNQTYVVPGTAATINNCLTFGGVAYTNPVIPNPTKYITVNNTSLGWGSFDTTQAVTIVSAPGVSFTLESGTKIHTGSVVYSRGNLNLVSEVYPNEPKITCYVDGNFSSSGGYKNVTVYCSGNATITSGFIGTVYCKGTVNVTGNFKGTVYCNGDFTMPSGSFEGLVVCGGNSNITASGGLNASYYAAGNISINSGVSGTNHVIYAGGNITLTGGCNSTVLFAGGNISLGSTTVNGAVIAKGNVTQSGWFTINYSRSAIQAIMDDSDNEFFFGSGGEPKLEENVFISQSITPLGRQT